jgi:hypothetical protein
MAINLFKNYKNKVIFYKQSDKSYIVTCMSY